MNDHLLHSILQYIQNTKQIKQLGMFSLLFLIGSDVSNCSLSSNHIKELFRVLSDVYIEEIVMDHNYIHSSILSVLFLLFID